MRDVIWTLIIIWLIYKLIDVFKAITVKKSYVNSQPTGHQQQSTAHSPGNHSKQDIQNAIKKHLNKEGEYVDFEEIK